MYRQAYLHIITCIHTDRQTQSQTDTKSDRHTDRQTYSELR
jgi:hypothetical protein